MDIPDGHDEGRAQAQIEFTEVEQLVLELGLEDAGSDHEFIETLTGYYATARHIAVGALRHVQDAEDAVQEAFIRAWNAREKFNGDSEVTTWLHRIVHNASLTELTRRNRRKTDSTDEMAENGSNQELVEKNGFLDPELAAEYKISAAEAVNRASEILSEKQRAVFALRIQEIGYGEIAETLGITESYAKVLMHRSRRRLEVALDWLDHNDDLPKSEV